MPSADILFVADRTRSPFGTKSLAEVEAISHEIVDWLLRKGASTIVVACNTASAAALDSLRLEFDAPVVGMEPAVKPAAAGSASGVIGVFATAATFQGRLFESVVDRHAGNTEVLTRACPEWVGLVEAGLTSGPAVTEAVREPVGSMVSAGADRLVLGCTHFPFLATAIANAADGKAAVVDPSDAVASQTLRVARETTGRGTLSIAASGDLHEMDRLIRSLVGLEYDATLLPF